MGTSLQSRLGGRDGGGNARPCHLYLLWTKCLKIQGVGGREEKQ